MRIKMTLNMLLLTQCLAALTAVLGGMYEKSGCLRCGVERAPDLSPDQDYALGEDARETRVGL